MMNGTRVCGTVTKASMAITIASGLTALATTSHAASTRHRPDIPATAAQIIAAVIGVCIWNSSTELAAPPR